MTESTLSEAPKRSELVSGKYEIHFEPGIHADLIPGITPKSADVIKKFESGDLTAHGWNPEVAERMKQYTPKIFALDSITGYPVINDDYWPWLPGSPKEMNGENAIYLVGGDHSNLEIGDAWGEVVKYANNTLGTEIPPHLILPFGLTFLLSRAAKEKLSRRDLLKVGLGLGTLSLADMLAKLAPWAASYSKDPDSLVNKVPQFVRPVFKSTWLDGRTALLILKIIDSMDRLHLPKGTAGSVVFGWPHQYESFRFMNDRQARQEAIRKFAIELTDDAYSKATDETYEWYYNDPGLKHLKLSEMPKKNLLMNSTLVSLASISVYEVREPEPQNSEKDPEKKEKLIRLVDYFLSPEVMEVASSLGDPKVIEEFARFFYVEHPETKSKF